MLAPQRFLEVHVTDLFVAILSLTPRAATWRVERGVGETE
jgi:hypothetical protein